MRGLRENLIEALATAPGPSSDFDFQPDPPAPATLRPAGVLAAFDARDGRLILTKRASSLRHHPGQISLPGGKVEPGDTDETAAALREAQEEVGLNPALVQVLGRLPAHETVTGYTVLPILGHVGTPFSPRAEAGEVEEVFHVPLAHVTDLRNFRIERRMWRGQWRRYYTVPCGPYYIWGATARMLRALAERLA